MIRKKNKTTEKQKGSLIISTMVFASIVVIIITALSSWAATTIQAGRLAFNREQAFQSAEAGIEYYRWHLAHAPTDYKDGTELPGPYIHELKDKNNNTAGEFALTIIPPGIGSSLVKIQSAGTSTNDTSQIRTVSSQVSKPSIAEHAFAGNSVMRFGEGTEVFGTIHSNGGIRFDGVANNVVSSSATTYDDPDHNDSGAEKLELGVHTHVNPPPGTGINNNYRPAEMNPLSIPSRLDVFRAGRKIGQPPVDFSGFSTDIATLQTSAIADGFYRDVVGVGYVGYHVVLKTDDTFDLYKINSWAGFNPGCYVSPSGTPSWSVGIETFQGNYPFPNNGIMFFEDHLVINGQVSTGRLTIIAADLPVPSNPSNYKNILINNDLLYTNYDGTDSIGLVAQGALLVGLYSEDDLKIDGALVSQFNNVGRPNYYDGSGGTCVYNTRGVITLYGMIASSTRYGFAYVGGGGYVIRNINYDVNLLYAPPPDFPQTSDQYQILSWQEE